MQLCRRHHQIWHSRLQSAARRQKDNATRQDKLGQWAACLDCLQRLLTHSACRRSVCWDGLETRLTYQTGAPEGFSLHATTACPPTGPPTFFHCCFRKQDSCCRWYTKTPLHQMLMTRQRGENAVPRTQRVSLTKGCQSHHVKHLTTTTQNIYSTLCAL